MVEAYRCDCRQPRRIKNVGGIEAPTKPGLEQQHIGWATGEGEHCRCSGDLKESDGRAGISRFALIEQGRKRIVID